jgi:hypothetical protein
MLEYILLRGVVQFSGCQETSLVTKYCRLVLESSFDPLFVESSNRHQIRLQRGDEENVAEGEDMFLLGSLVDDVEGQRAGSVDP